MHDEFVPLAEAVLAAGAYRAAVIPVETVETDASFRDMCKANVCGNYGKSWTCPPDAGDIHALMAELRTYSQVLVFQTVSQLEDSFDFEGMMEAGTRHNQLMQSVRSIAKSVPARRMMMLGAGGCRVCPVCAKKTDEPCRHPDLAMSSLETYGINVSKLAAAAGMKYINGKDTVTYFGAVFFGD